jgi:endoglucanase Acf2
MRRNHNCFLLIFGLISISVVFHQGFAQTVTVGKGSYATTGGTGIVSFNPYVTADFSQKSISDKWWVTLISTQYSQEMFAHPVAYQAVAGGLEMAYPGAPTGSAGNFSSAYSKSITIGISGLNAPDARVARYGHFSVTARWTSGATVMEATMAQGLPFVYCTITGSSAAIACNGTPTIFANQGNVLGITVGGKNFGIFAPTGATWSGTGTLTSTLNGKDYLSVALLPDASTTTLAFFKQYAYTFAADTKVDILYDEARGYINATFRIVPDVKEGTETGTVFALLRHQWLNTGAALTSYTYQSPRGLMKVTSGQSFTTVMKFNGILPAFPDTGYTLATLNSLLGQISSSCGSGDTYAAGKSLGKVACGAQSANLVGNTTVRDNLLGGLKTALEGWFTAGGSQQFYYHAPWNQYIGYPASYGSDARFADHHFHYGYFVQAAAAIAQTDTSWVSQQNWGGMVNMLIRNVSTPDDNDPLFGRFAYFDPSEGHGWADGLGFTNGNNQESSSESMNFNAGLIMWGVNTGNTTLRDLGIFLYETEARAIEQYWWDVDNAVFPSAYTHPSVGQVWSDGGAWGTWFSGDVSAIVGINILPITPGHMYLGRRPDYIPTNYAAGNNGGWNDLFTEYLAFSDAASALSKYNAGVGTEAGNTKALCYHIVSSLNTVGTLDTAVTANIPTFAVFDKGSVRTYNVYNPDFVPRTVTFNDGFSMTVPARKQIHATGSNIPVSVPVPVTRAITVRPVPSKALFSHGAHFAMRNLAATTRFVALYSLTGEKMWESGVASRRALAEPNVPSGLYIVKEFH